MKLHLLLLAGLFLLSQSPSAGAQALEGATLNPSQAGQYHIGFNGLSVHMNISKKDEYTRLGNIEIFEQETSVHQSDVEVNGSAFYGPFIRIEELDPENNLPEIMISHYTGGAHCCTQVSIISKTSGGWKEIDMGSFDGDPDRIWPRDVNYDDVLELVIYDNAFLYQFASYAGSFAPPKILGVRGGKYQNLTKQGEFQDFLKSEYENLSEMPEEGATRNSWLAAKAAHELLLGYPAERVLSEVEELQDNRSDWGFNRCTVKLEDGICPEGKSESVTFGVALRDFLTATGYLEEK